MNEEDLTVKASVRGVYIPGEVAFNDELSSSEKLLFGIVWSLSGSSKGCYASNEYLAKSIGLSKISVSRYLSHLQKQGYIISVLTDTSVGTRRNIYIPPEFHKKYENIVRDWNDNLHKVKEVKEHNTVLAKEDIKNDNAVTQICISDKTIDNAIEGHLIQKDVLSVPFSFSEKPKSCLCAIKSTPNKEGDDMPPTVIRRLNKGEDVPPTQTESSTPQRRLVRGDGSSALERMITAYSNGCGPDPMPGPPGGGNGDRRVKALPPVAVQLISYWNNKAGATKHKLPLSNEQPSITVSRATKYIERLLNGQMFSNGDSCNINFTEIVTPSDIEEAIDNFREMIDNINMLPINKETLKKYSFPDFILSQHNGRSYFVTCFNKEFKYRQEMFVPKKYKIFFDALKASFDKYVKSDRDFSPSDLSKITKGSEMLYNTMDRIGEDLLYFLSHERPLDETLIADWVLESIIHKFGHAVIGNLSSHYTYNTLLPKYLQNKGILPGGNYTNVREEKDFPTKSEDDEHLEWIKESKWYVQASDI